jgi:predicted GIY-YIG superfamily endonuclease
MTYIYIVRQNCPNGAVKIGVSDDPIERLRTLQTASPIPLVIIHAARFEGRAQALNIEARMHEEFGKQRLSSCGGEEWFHPHVVKRINKIANRSSKEKKEEAWADFPATVQFCDRRIRGTWNEVTQALRQVLRAA